MKQRPKQLDSPIVPKIIKTMSRANVWLYRKTNGRLGGKWRIGSAFPRGVPLCLLTTRGRVSGQPRTAPLLYLRDGARVVLVASQGCLPRDPQWYRNVQNDPEVVVQIGADEQVMRAHTADDEERARLWPQLVDVYQDFESYQAWTDRTIPVVVCEPLA
jgi:deazaflavin-dependent oxidoreductase (nitroreductase family)